MTARVIQGLFSGGRPKLAAAQPRTAPPPIQARTIARPPGPPATAFAVRSPGPPAPAFSGRPPAAPGFAGQQGTVQRHGAGGAFLVEARPLGLISNGGRPLPEAVRGQMEAALGADFSSVRVHVGPQAERIGAIAFTVGSDIYFAPGRYQPDTIHGQQLLGHELTHVVQQRAGRVRNPLGAGLAVVQDHALEAEADRMGQRAAMHRVAAQAKLAPGAPQGSAPVRISAPVSAGSGSYRLSAGAGGREIGSVMVHARDRGAVEVTDLGVDAAQRGNGVGRMLVAAAARAGLQSGRSKVTLAAQDRGTGHLTSWYRKMGFTQIGVNRRGYPQLEAPISRLITAAARIQDQPHAGPLINRKTHQSTMNSMPSILRLRSSPAQKAAVSSMFDADSQHSHPGRALQAAFISVIGPESEEFPTTLADGAKSLAERFTHRRNRLDVEVVSLNNLNRQRFDEISDDAVIYLIGHGDDPSKVKVPRMGDKDADEIVGLLKIILKGFSEKNQFAGKIVLEGCYTGAAISEGRRQTGDSLLDAVLSKIQGDKNLKKRLRPEVTIAGYKGQTFDDNTTAGLYSVAEATNELERVKYGHPQYRVWEGKELKKKNLPLKGEDAVVTYHVGQHSSRRGRRRG